MKLNYPLKDGRLKYFLNAAEHYHINEFPSPELNELQRGGWFPIGMNDFWHAGIHFDGDRPVHAVADGEIVAYRITNNYIQPSDLAQTFDGAKKKNRKFINFPISNNFVLTRHLFKPPEGASFSFYLLYMHLLPHRELSDDQKKYPSIFHQFPVSVKHFDKPDGAGLQLVDGYHLKEIIVMPKGSVVEKLDNRRLPDEIFKRGYSRVRAHVYNTTFTGYADLNNDRHLKQYGDRYLVDTTIHPNPEKTGLNVRIYPIPASAVVDVVPVGAMIYFDESAGEITDEQGILKSFPEPERYKKIKGYRHNGRDYKIDGYIDTHTTYLETKRRYEPEMDGVTCPNDLRIEKGDVLGWSGRDGTADKKRMVHVELFMKTKKDLDALRRYTDAQLKKQTDLDRETLLNLDEAGIISEKEIIQAYIRVDFMCDVSGLVMKSSNGKNRIIKMGIEEAVADKYVAPILRKMVAKHHPEWLPNDKGEKIRERLMEPPYMWPQEKYDAYKELYFDKLGFWDQLEEKPAIEAKEGEYIDSWRKTPQKFPDECYYFHPIKFIEHCKLLEPKIEIETVNKKGKRIPYERVYGLYNDKGERIHRGTLKYGKSVYSDFDLDPNKDYYVWLDESMGTETVPYDNGDYQVFRKFVIEKGDFLTRIYQRLGDPDWETRYQNDYYLKINGDNGPAGSKNVQQHGSPNIVDVGDVYYIPLEKISKEEKSIRTVAYEKETEYETWYVDGWELVTGWTVIPVEGGVTLLSMNTLVYFILETEEETKVYSAQYEMTVQDIKGGMSLNGSVSLSGVYGSKKFEKGTPPFEVAKSYVGPFEILSASTPISPYGFGAGGSIWYDALDKTNGWSGHSIAINWGVDFNTPETAHLIVDYKYVEDSFKDANDSWMAKIRNTPNRIKRYYSKEEINKRLKNAINNR